MTGKSLKIGVLTFHRCINYGSYWQARCLVEGLRGRGHDAVLLDHVSPEVNSRELRCAFQPQLPVRTPRSDHPAYGRKTRTFLQAQEGLPLSRRFDLDTGAPTEAFDAVVVGSDEVWNFQHPWFGGKSLFFGERLGARLVSYAASFGNHDAQAGMDPFWADLLRRFSAISVRDENARQLVSQALGIEPAMVLDPCLQFAGEIPDATAAGDSAYAVVYGHTFPDWFVPQVRGWADAEGLRLVSIGYRNDWADEQRIDAGPEEFNRLMAGAAAVATNYFHGCVFALRHGRPFACAATPYRRNKLRDLTAQVGAAAHLVDESATAETYRRLLGAPLDPAIPATIARLRQAGDAFLDRALA
ncbi:polysaccharide pyruvyl transferase family protein [Sphingomonas aracearum]|uniref:Polysaccharide pyruvyl transferase family protein n=1 Tax=Sphingomonas aracearum TaxID=2283317 RepID=A0A369VXA3_9SPHN|nr:polysaccharide pyruvyl transferase family protein [Sphingomonas aracearum]RDE06763.1 polysaccharide pyruvyl transferase family protein [Sphingomonas aracearum]